VLLADEILGLGLGRDRVFQGLDVWGYSFREGCAQRWLESNGLIDAAGEPTWELRPLVEYGIWGRSTYYINR